MAVDIFSLNSYKESSIWFDGLISQVNTTNQMHLIQTGPSSEQNPDKKLQQQGTCDDERPMHIQLTKERAKSWKRNFENQSTEGLSHF